MQGRAALPEAISTPAGSAVADIARLLLLHAMLATYRLWSLPGSPASLFLVPMAEAFAIVGAFKLGEGFGIAARDADSIAPAIDAQGRASVRLSKRDKLELEPGF